VSAPRRSSRSKCSQYDKTHPTNAINRTIIDRKHAISNIVSDTSPSEVLELHHFWADNLHTAILHHTHAENMAIVDRILELPRELRDHIYARLWDVEEDYDPNRDLIYWWELFEKPWLEKDDNISRSPWLRTPAVGLRPPHFVDKAFVETKFVREVLKRFRDAIGKDLRPVGERNPVAECGLIDMSVKDLVEKDVFCVGITVEELVRNMDLRINFQTDVLSDTVAELKGHYLEELNDNVTALVSIPYTDRIVTHNENSRRLQKRPRIVTLAIRQEYGFVDGNNIRSILKLVARAYHGLREKGFRVKVQYYSEEIGLKVLFEDDVCGWTSEDWTANLKQKNTIGEYSAEHIDIAYDFQECVWKDIRDHLFQSHGAREQELR
jgi:hypothetical protein